MVQNIKKGEKIKFTNRENLKWAREKSGLRLEDVYKKTKWTSKKKKIEKWEEGSDFPTISELRKLGNVYKRPWTLFIIEKKVSDLGFKTLEFRKIDMGLGPSSHLFEFLNELKKRQDFLIEFADILALKTNQLVGACKEIKDKKDMAEKIISSTEIDMNTFWKKRTRPEAFNYLVERLAQKNIFVSNTNSNFHKKIAPQEMRGVLLNSSTAPIIGINTQNESYGARIFTVFHELTHLFRGDSFNGDVEVTKIDFRNQSKKDAKERFCDAVAAQILAPDSMLEKIKDSITKELVENKCIELKINHEPLLYRMQEFGLLNETEVEELLKNLKEDKIDQQKNKDKNGGPDGGYLKILQNGKAFVRTVNALHSQGEITLTQALNVLNVKAKTYKKFAGKI